MTRIIQIKCCSLILVAVIQKDENDEPHKEGRRKWQKRSKNNENSIIDKDNEKHSDKS